MLSIIIIAEEWKSWMKESPLTFMLEDEMIGAEL
jgi:hypothetical protein